MGKIKEKEGETEIKIGGMMIEARDLRGYFRAKECFPILAEPG